MATKNPDGMPQEPNKMSGSARLPVHDRDVARATELHTKVIKLLSSTTNSCLAELGYYPNIQSDLRGALDRNHTLETNNVKLFEDNRKLAGIVAVQNDRLAFLDAPQSEQLQKVLEIKDRVCYLQADLARKNQDKARLEVEYRNLHEKYGRLRMNYDHLVKELHDARMDIARYRGIPNSNAMVQSAQGNPNHVPLGPAPLPWPNAPGMPASQLYSTNVERLPERRPSSDGQMGVGSSQSSLVQYSSASTTPTHTSAPVHSLQPQRRVSDGLSRQRPLQSPDPYTIGWGTMNGHAAGPPPRPLHQVPSTNMHSSRPMISMHGPAHAQRARPPEHYSPTAASPPGHSVLTTIPTPSEALIATHNSHPNRSFDPATTPTSTRSLHFPVDVRIRIPTDQDPSHRLDGIVSAPPVPGRTFQTAYTSNPPQQSPISSNQRSVLGHGRMVGFVDLTVDDSPENRNVTSTISPVAPPPARPEVQSPQGLKRPSTVIDESYAYPARDDANKRPRMAVPTSLPQRSPVTGYHTPVSQASHSPNIRASEPEIAVMQEPANSYISLAPRSTTAAQTTSAPLEWPSDQAPASSSIPQPPNTGESTETPVQDTHPACTSPREEAINLIFEQDPDEPEGKRCRLCDCRYEANVLPERPPVWMRAKIDDLVQHCVTEHPAAWEHLQKRADQAQV